ncbi:hypothetical protein L207DRAFT_519222 [Hyaloscypha variabilis F]|uniref:Uncharacterized protein n=1 Tax=Hyaloscypha variabilis (strain UAMH 11265 / GT02V1 / F) TaxID=1149755 RepID=A0A2J6R070_HYAVF|nr:hypothetical protein L207DRAFT_519222 [Hyaloscypha variabilis F]
MFFHSKPFLVILMLRVQNLQAAPVPDVLSTEQSTKTSSEILTQGWTPSPNGRGSIDIVWSCVATIFLCSWSVLCLHIPSTKDTRFKILWRRLWLTFLCALGPEFILQLALGQWSSAKQSVRDFRASIHDPNLPEWTMKHAFYADSGGFFLCTPDFKPIPLDAKQLLYLINRKYIEPPVYTEKDIDDKNKMDVLIRFVSVLQILWFTVTIIARAAEGLVITGLEITTAAFVLCSLGATFCWWHKGADVGVPEYLTTQTTMADILKDGGDAAGRPYHRTPLDFISRKEWHWSLYWTHWINILRKMHIIFAPRVLPYDRIENTTWPDLKERGAWPMFIFMTLAYIALFLAAWNDHFPTKDEQTAWRISSLSMLACVILYFSITGFAYLLYPKLQRYFRPRSSLIIESENIDATSQKLSENQSELISEKPALVIELPGSSLQVPKARSRLSSLAASIRNNSILKDPSLDVPLKAQLPMYLVGFTYCSSRTIIWVLDIIQFRDLPASAFATVNWGSYIGHLA